MIHVGVFNHRRERVFSVMCRELVTHVLFPKLAQGFLSGSQARRETVSVFASFVLVLIRDRARFGEELVDFFVVGFERVAHDEEVAAVVRDRVPVDNIWLMPILKIGDGTGAS